MKRYAFRNILMVFCMVICLPTFSQYRSNHELSVYIGGGLSTLNYDANIGSRKNKAGGLFGVGYNYHLNEMWSIGSGIELSLYNTEYELKEITDAYNSNDGEYDFEFRSRMSNYKEDQSAMFVSIPLTARFEVPVFGDTRFYTSAGIKFGIPVVKKYEVSQVDLYNSGYYPVWSGEGELILDTQEFMGFGTYNGYKQKKENAELKTAFIGMIDAGLSWKLQNSLALYTGAYFEYSLNDIRKNSEKHPVEYDTTADKGFIINSSLDSQYRSDGEYRPMADKIHPVAVGLKIRLAFRL